LIFDILRARSGFDFGADDVLACCGLSKGHTKNRQQKINATSTDMAPSLKEASETLAAFGYEERELLAA
jgi:hypothetical protein